MIELCLQLSTMSAQAVLIDTEEIYVYLTAQDFEVFKQAVCRVSIIEDWLARN
jgi:hypothetical protein